MVEKINDIPNDPKVSPVLQTDELAHSEGVDALTIAYFLLVQATNLMTENSAIKVKELANNAEIQKHLNGLIKDIDLYHVPDLIETKNNGLTQFKNDTEVRNFEAKNQRLLQFKSILEDKASLWQQKSQTTTADLNTQDQLSLTDESEASNFISTLRELLYKVMLRKPSKYQ